MKNKTHKLLFMHLVTLLMLISIGLFAQTNDTAVSGNSNAGDISQFFDALFSILVTVGVPIPGWVKLLLPIIGGWLIHFITKKVSKAKTATKIETILAKAPPTELQPEHRNALQRLVDKLRGRKTN